MTRTEELIALESSLGAHNYKPLDVALTRGEGVYVYDVDGKRYLDCLSAYSGSIRGTATRAFSRRWWSRRKS